MSACLVMVTRAGAHHRGPVFQRAGTPQPSAGSAVPVFTSLNIASSGVLSGHPEGDPTSWWVVRTSQKCWSRESPWPDQVRP
jgi:hypothetical protein